MAASVVSGNGNGGGGGVVVYPFCCFAARHTRTCKMTTTTTIARVERVYSSRFRHLFLSLCLFLKAMHHARASLFSSLSTIAKAESCDCDGR